VGAETALWFKVKSRFLIIGRGLVAEAV